MTKPHLIIRPINMKILSGNLGVYSEDHCWICLHFEKMHATFVVASRHSLLSERNKLRAEQPRDRRFFSSPTPLRPNEQPFRNVLGAVPQQVNQPGRDAGYSPPPSSKFVQSVQLYLHTSNALTPWRWIKSKETFTFTFYIWCTSNKANKTEWGQEGSLMSVG